MEESNIQHVVLFDTFHSFILKMINSLRIMYPFSSIVGKLGVEKSDMKLYGHFDNLVIKINEKFITTQKD